jgi:RHS repeat-associated protein
MISAMLTPKILETDALGRVRTSRERREALLERFDEIGNRTEMTIDAGTAASYTSNLLNQYTNIVTTEPVSPLHDADGNLTDDGIRLFEWDGENRLAAVKRKADGALVATYTYDDQGRRVRKITTAIAAQGTSDTVFAWDGWNMIAEMDYDTWTYNPIRFYTWGLDLSGSTHGAGGVGGLLMEQDSGTAATYFTSYDGNGNLVNLVNVANGTIAAEYEYGPFGEPLRATGAMAESNPFRFSTKYQDQKTGLLYYGYRYYNPETGRWLSRDPIEEKGGLNLYGFAKNDAIRNVDVLGKNLTLAVNVTRNRPTPYAYGVNLSVLIEIIDLPESLKRELESIAIHWTGFTAGAGAGVYFFPDSCEIGAFSITAGALDLMPSVPEENVAAGLFVGVGGAFEVAVRNPSGSRGTANSGTFAGYFRTFQGGVGWGAGIYYGLGPDRRFHPESPTWYGGTVSPPFVSGGLDGGAAVVDWNYQPIGSAVDLKRFGPAGKCACVAIAGAMP